MGGSGNNFANDTNLFRLFLTVTTFLILFFINSKASNADLELLRLQVESLRENIGEIKDDVKEIKKDIKEIARR